MKGQRTRTIVVCVVVIAIIAAAVIAISPGRATAALGNRNVPVRCYAIGDIPAGGQAFLRCIASDGTPFGEAMRVPAGYYLVVTDMWVTPRGGSTVAGVTEVNVFDGYDTNSRQSQYILRGTTSASYGRSFAAAYLVLYPGHRLDITAAGYNAFPVDVRISGYLVNNVTYIPMIENDF